MGVDRRQFLKIAGLSALAGLGAKSAFELLAPGKVEAALPLMEGKRWAMVIDMRHMTEEIMRKCREACHHVHNVPEFGDPKVEIKWIWEEEFEHAFPDQENDYVADKIKHQDFLLLCNHCSNPPCHRGNLAAGGRNRHDGLASVHRVPVLHGRLPVRVQEL